MRRSVWIAMLGLAGCAGDLGGSSEDHGHDRAFALEAADEIEDELRLSPAHLEEAAFARVSVHYRARAPLPIEVATSSDGGETWSAWREGVLSAEASDAEMGTWVADVDDVEEGATLWRVRVRAGAIAMATPSALAVDTSDADELAAEATLAVEDEPEGGVAAPAEDDLGAVSLSATSFRRYRYDLGRVGRSWLWLLRAARRRGWTGSLYGPRTGLRTYAEQAALWNAYQRGTGAPAFPPWGPSRHLIRNVRGVGTWYQAVDTSDVPRLIRIASRLGVSLHTPYAREPWHVEARRRFAPPAGWTP